MNWEKSRIFKIFVARCLNVIMMDFLFYFLFLPYPNAVDVKMLIRSLYMKIHFHSKEIIMMLMIALKDF